MASGILGFVDFSQSWVGRRQYYSQRFQSFVDAVFSEASNEGDGASRSVQGLK